MIILMDLNQVKIKLLLLQIYCLIKIYWNSDINGVIEIWDLKNKVCKRKLDTNITEHKGQNLEGKFLNGNNKVMKLINLDNAGLVNIVYLT